MENVGESLPSGIMDRAEQCLGVWIPKGEEHLRWMIEKKSKTGLVGGKGTYQLHKLRLAMEYCDSFRVALDIGSHVGLWSMHLTDKFQHVHAFDPIPLHHELYALNVEGAWTQHMCALGSQPGTCSLDYTPTNSGRTHVTHEYITKEDELRATTAREQHITQVTAEVKTLDSYEFEDVDFVKIDVEGFELSVVMGGLETLQRCRPTMVIEQKGNDAKNFGATKNAALELLQSVGAKSARDIGGDHIMVWQ